MYGANSYANHTYGGNTRMPITIFFYENISLSDALIKLASKTRIENLSLIDSEAKKIVRFLQEQLNLKDWLMQFWLKKGVHPSNWTEVKPQASNWTKVEPQASNWTEVKPPKRR